MFWQRLLAQIAPAGDASSAGARAEAVGRIPIMEGRGRGGEPAPTGTVGVLIVDLLDAPALWATSRRHMRAAVRTFGEVVRAAAARHRGYEARQHGDAFMLIFASPSSALAAAADIVAAMPSASWPAGWGAGEATTAHTRVAARAAVHVGDPLVDDSTTAAAAVAAAGAVSRVGPVRPGPPQYMGEDINRASLLCALSRGDDVVLSERYTRTVLSATTPVSLPASGAIPPANSTVATLSPASGKGGGLESGLVVRCAGLAVLPGCGGGADPFFRAALGAPPRANARLDAAAAADVKAEHTFSGALAAVPCGSAESFVDVGFATGGGHATSTTPAPVASSLVLCFTDIQGSTELWNVDAACMLRVLALHNSILRSHIRAFAGYEVKTEGDAFMVVFDDPIPAAQWALHIQAALLEAEWPSSPPIASHHLFRRRVEAGTGVVWNGPRVRVGIHAAGGECDVFAERDPLTGRMDYFGVAVNKAARVASAAHGGEVVCTAAVAAAVAAAASVGAPLAPAASPVAITPLGPSQLKGFSDPEALFRLGAAALAAREQLFGMSGAHASGAELATLSGRSDAGEAAFDDVGAMTPQRESFLKAQLASVHTASEEQCARKAQALVAALNSADSTGAAAAAAATLTPAELDMRRAVLAAELRHVEERAAAARRRAAEEAGVVPGSVGRRPSLGVESTEGHSPLSLYRLLCAKAALTPLSYLDAALPARVGAFGAVKFLDLPPAAGLNNEQVAPICALLKYCLEVSRVALSCAQLRHSGVRAICATAEVHPTLSSLRLSGNPLPPECGADLLRVVSVNHRITELDVAECGLPHDIAASIAAAVARNALALAARLAPPPPPPPPPQPAPPPTAAPAPAPGGSPSGGRVRPGSAYATRLAQRAGDDSDFGGVDPPAGPGTVQY